MADLVQQLSEYKVQLQQVEATLATDPDNEDLQKLKHDLQEVINLTQELVKTSEAEAGTSRDDVGSSSLSHSAETALWEVGDRCQAIYSEDGQYYDAVIDEILEDGSCTVTFEEYQNTEVSQVLMLRQREGGKRGADGHDGPDSKKPKTKKDVLKAQQEYKKKKNEKKRLRSKQLEEERETEKNKWLDFNAKAFSKTSKGKVKRSIFATPDAVNGRVGVGTCGIGGQPMTSFNSMEKWKK